MRLRPSVPNEHRMPAFPPLFPPKRLPLCWTGALECLLVSSCVGVQQWRKPCDAVFRTARSRSEEHTSELQSRLHLVCRLLLEKKKHTSRNLLTTHSDMPVC